MPNQGEVLVALENASYCRYVVQVPAHANADAESAASIASTARAAVEHDNQPQLDHDIHSADASRL